MDAIGDHQVVIIAGDTGCGKVNSGTGLKKSLTELIVQQLHVICGQSNMSPK